MLVVSKLTENVFLFKFTVDGFVISKLDGDGLVISKLDGRWFSYF